MHAKLSRLADLSSFRKFFNRSFTGKIHLNTGTDIYFSLDRLFHYTILYLKYRIKGFKFKMSRLFIASLKTSDLIHSSARKENN